VTEASICPGKVEFLGICGAGKTTVMNHFTEVYGKKFSATIVMPRSKHSRLKFLFRAIWIVLRTVFSGTAGVVSYFFVPCKLWLPLKLSYRLAGCDYTGQASWKFYVDSGMLQPFVSFEAEENRYGAKVPLAALIQCIPLPEVVVFVNVPPETALERYCQRGGQAVSRYEENRLREMFYAADAIAQELVLACRVRGVQVIEVGNDSIEALSNAADTIYDTLIQCRKWEGS